MSAALLTRAAQALRDGRLDDAVTLLQTALADDPRQPDAWYNLAWAQRALRRFDEALESYSAALIHGLTNPADAHVNRAAILSDHLFRSDAARDELQQAVTLNPSSFQAWLSLGNLAEDEGDVEGAECAYRRVLQIAPSSGRAHARLATIATQAGEARAAGQRLKAQLDNIEAPEDRAEILFALGGALDATADYADAFQAYEAANWLTRSIAPRRYDPAAQTLFVDRQIAAFAHRIPSPIGDVAPPPTPLFVCGMFRSGSTLIEQILGRHPAVTAGGELEFIPALAQSIADYPSAVPRSDAEILIQWQAAYRAALPALGLVTDKRCDNIMHLGLVKTL